MFISDGPGKQAKDAHTQASGAEGLVMMNRKQQEMRELRGTAIMAATNPSRTVGGYLTSDSAMQGAGVGAIYGFTRIGQVLNPKEYLGRMTDTATDVMRQGVDLSAEQTQAFHPVYGRYGKLQIAHEAAAAGVDGGGGFEINMHEMSKPIIDKRLRLLNELTIAYGGAGAKAAVSRICRYVPGSNFLFGPAAPLTSLFQHNRALESGVSDLTTDEMIKDLREGSGLASRRWEQMPFKLEIPHGLRGMEEAIRAYHKEHPDEPMPEFGKEVNSPSYTGVSTRGGTSDRPSSDDGFVRRVAKGVGDGLESGFQTVAFYSGELEGGMVQDERSRVVHQEGGRTDSPGVSALSNTVQSTARSLVQLPAALGSEAPEGLRAAVSKVIMSPFRWIGSKLGFKSGDITDLDREMLADKARSARPGNLAAQEARTLARGGFVSSATVFRLANEIDRYEAEEDAREAREAMANGEGGVLKR